MTELLANGGVMAGLIIGAAILLAAILLVLFRRKGGGEANVEGLRAELQQLGGRFSGITDTQTAALGDLTRTLNDRLNQGVGAIQGAVQTIGTKLDADVAAMEKSAVAGPVPRERHPPGECNVREKLTRRCPTLGTPAAATLLESRRSSRTC